MTEPFKVRVEFFDSTAYDNIDQVCSLVASFNQQTNLEIDWSASLYQGTKIANLAFQGTDAQKTISCAEFVCETINEGNTGPLTYAYPEGEYKVMVH